MITFDQTEDGYVFIKNSEAIAVGVYENSNFCLFHKDDLSIFDNSMQAYVHLRSIYEPKVARPDVLALFTTPSRAIDNMSKFKDNEYLKDIPKEVFHANLPN